MVNHTEAVADLQTAGKTLIGRWGLNADPVGAHATFTLSGRDYIVTITGVTFDRGCWLVQTRHMNGETAPTVRLSMVNLLHRDF